MHTDDRTQTRKRSTSEHIDASTGMLYVQVHCMHAGPLRITLGLLRLFLGCLVLCPTIAWCIITLPPPVLFVLLDFSQCQVSFHLQSELGSWLGTATVTFGSQERKHVFSTVCKHKRILLQSLFGIHPVFCAASEVRGWTCIGCRIVSNCTIVDRQSGIKLSTTCPALRPSQSAPNRLSLCRDVHWRPSTTCDTPGSRLCGPTSWLGWQEQFVFVISTEV